MTCWAWDWLSRSRLLSMGGMQGYVDLAVICSFSRMAQALGIPPKGPVSPQTVAQVGMPAGAVDELQL